MRCESAIVVSSGLPMVLVEEPVAREPARPLQLDRALRVDEHEDAQRLGLGPEGVELRVAQLEALDTAAEAGAAQAVALDALLELLGGEVRMLERHAREGDEPVGLGRADLGERLVLDADQLRRDVPVRRVPVGVDAERLHVDALRVHRLEALPAYPS